MRCLTGKSVIISEIARITTSNNKRVLFLVHRRELIDQIRETFIANEVNLNLVQFGMVQTVVKRLDKTEKPSLIITDESHHAKAKTYQKIYDYFHDVLRLSFTATPIRLKGETLYGINDILIEEVDAEYLIENGFLSPYKYYAPKLIDESYLKVNNMGEFSNASIDEMLEKNMIYGNAVEHYKKLAPGEQAIVYCHSIAASENIVQAFKDAGISAAHIDGKTNKLERANIIEKFRQKEIQVLSNVDLIGEGFNVPDCSTVIMLRPTKSLSLYIQQSMRGMRYQPGKTSIIIDHVGNVNRHGLPDMKRTWTLEPKTKKQKEENQVKIKVCENCFAALEPEMEICPICGHEIKQEEEEDKKKEYEIDEHAELEEINKEEFVFTMDFRKPEDCRSLKELQDLAKNRGYKPGWAWFQAKRLNIIR